MGFDALSTRAPATGGARRKPLVPSGVFAMLLFVAAETMMFAGLVSAFLITRTSAPGGVWPPPGQPRLPVEETAVNTAALLLSGLFLVVAHRRFARVPASARGWLVGAILLGAFFVAFQGVEWLALIGEGLTLTSSAHGAFFYLIVGMHALHAVVALSALAWAAVRLQRGRLTAQELWTTEVFWFFVVGLWPFLYAQVYL